MRDDLEYKFSSNVSFYFNNQMRSRQCIDDYAKFKEDVRSRCNAELSHVDSEYEHLKFLLSEDYHMKVAGQYKFYNTKVVKTTRSGVLIFHGNIFLEVRVFVRKMMINVK